MEHLGPEVEQLTQAVRLLQANQQPDIQTIRTICASLHIEEESFTNLWTFFPGAENLEIRKGQFFQILRKESPHFVSVAQQIDHDLQPVRRIAQEPTKPSTPQAAAAAAAEEVDPISQEPIPAEYRYFLGETPYDARSLLVGILSSVHCTNPLTNEELSDEQLLPLCRKFHINIHAFRALWEASEDAGSRFIQENAGDLDGDEQARYLEENDSEIVDFKRDFRIDQAVQMIADNDPVLAVAVNEVRGK